MRIPLLTPETMTADQRRVYDQVVAGPRGKVQGPLLAALHQPELADRWQKFGEILRYRTTLPPKLNELAIIVTARLWNCQLEWLVHAEAALKAGLSADVVEDIRHGRDPAGADPSERLVYDYCRELQQRRFVSAKTYEAATRQWGVVGVVELTALIGYYTMVAMTLNAHEIPLPAGATPQLPDLEPPR